ncbi:MAG: putative glycoside hydrolase [Leptospirales bacterium]|nr:putative glycoside hydrolase [Leptospirales bacterium]
MNKRLKYIAITIIIFFALLVIIGFGYYRYYEISGTISRLKSFIMPSVEDKQYSAGSGRTASAKKTFGQLPPGFFHFAPFFLFKAEEDSSVDEVAKAAIEYTSVYRISLLKQAIISANSLKDNKILKGQCVVIPEPLDPLLPNAGNSELPAIISARGLYLTGRSAGKPAFLESVPSLKKKGINAIVFDVKDVDGILHYKSRVPLALKHNLHENAAIDNVDMFIKNLKSKGIYIIARIAVFRDILLVKKAPELAIKSRSSQKIWKGGGEVWCDPTNKTVQDYITGLALEIAQKGVDEVQFDYIRFPTGGNIGDAAYSFECGVMSREDVIASFLKQAYEKISAENVRLSIDIFGVVAWGKKVDINSTGQRIELLSRYCDYISPMLYPSHFENHFDGYANPADNPYYFINEGNKKVMSLLSNKEVVIRPWVQAFKWKVTSFGPQYIIKQIKASDDSGAKGYLFWNASNEYKNVLTAMESLTQSGEVK